jgi:hypothetical protein
MEACDSHSHYSGLSAFLNIDPYDWRTVAFVAARLRVLVEKGYTSPTIGDFVSMKYSQLFTL